MLKPSPQTLSPRLHYESRAAGWELHPVPPIPALNDSKGAGQHRYKQLYTKLHAWGLDSEAERIILVQLDADMLVRRGFAELFALPWDFGTVPDVHHSH